MSGTLPAIRSVALIGFGEAGSLLAEGCANAGLRVAAYDVKCDDEALRPVLAGKASQMGVTLHDSPDAAIKGADLIISAVTAASATQAAESAARLIGQGQYFMDINSVSPATKEADRGFIEGAGAFYIESAVMAPVPPYGLKVPMLLGGARAAALSESLNALGFSTRAVATQVGVASAIKMCRSVMIKGLEALTVESMMAARHYGAEREVLASLAETFPGMGWTDALPHYLISRVAEHGRRRAAEMREVMDTLQDAGIVPIMSEATARAQDALVDAMRVKGIGYPTDDFDWVALADDLRQ